MTDTQTMTLDSLRDIGLGPNRIARALEGEMLFGPGGLLNSIELVQFMAALSERSGIEAFELMESFQGPEGFNVPLAGVLDLLDHRNARQVMAG
ncbi:MAG: hypothetical protein IE922_09600 [Sphingomonadales bacterium]|nr:hypothetical protein [Sphingomonadales bacterium]